MTIRSTAADLPPSEILLGFPEQGYSQQSSGRREQDVENWGREDYSLHSHLHLVIQKRMNFRTQIAKHVHVSGRQAGTKNSEK